MSLGHDTKAPGKDTASRPRMIDEEYAVVWWVRRNDVEGIFLGVPGIHQLPDASIFSSASSPVIPVVIPSSLAALLQATMRAP